MDSFLNLAYSMECDAFALSETWLTPTTDLVNRDFNFIRQDREVGMGGGVLIGLRKGYSFYRVALPKFKHMEAVACQVNIRGMDVCIVSIYVPPNAQISFLRRELWGMAERLQAPRLVLGDFNSHGVWGGEPEDARAKIIMDFCDDFQMSYLNSGQATRVPRPPARASAIDLSLCTNSMVLDCVWEVIQDPHGSDHLPIAIRVCNGPTQSKPVNISYDLTRNIDWNQYAAIVSVEIDAGTNLSPLEKYKFLVELILQSATQAQTKPIPGPRVNRYPPNRWWDKECTELKAKRSAAFIQSRKDGKPESYQRYFELDEEFGKLLKSKKSGYWRRYVGGTTPQTAMRELWGAARSMRNRVITNEGEEYSDRWILDFAKKVCPDSAPAQQAYREVQGGSEPPFTMIELSMALLSCNNTAPGIDGIKFNLLKNLPDDAKRELLELFNKFLELNIVPPEWRQVKVIAIKKPNKPASEPNSYRPISMLPCLRKLFEKMILFRMEKWFESNNLLSDTQFGFRRGKGTNDCLALLATEAEMAYGTKQEMASVFLDIKGAFDSVSIEVLTEKLHASRLSPGLCNFLTNLLSEKHMHFSSGSSTITRISWKGLAQGSSMAPLLYNFYVGDIDDCLDGRCTIRQLADDAVVSITGPTKASLQEPLQNTLNNLAAWAVVLGIEFSPEKTECVVFSKRINSSKLQLSLSGQTIEQSLSYKYLGVIFDSKGTWGKHIQYVKQKCLKRINFLRMITGTWWGAHPQDVLLLYKTTILSVMEYGSFCFRTAVDTHIKVLERIQYRCLRIALGCMHSTHNMSLEVIAGVMPIRSRFYELSFRFLIRCDIRNPLVITNFETLLSLGVKTKRMSLYYAYIAQDINPSWTEQASSSSPAISSISVSFDTSMKPAVHGIPKSLRPQVVPPIFASKYNQIPSSKVFYTDGSLIDDNTGFGVFHESFQIFYKLNDPCSVYVAELAAIYTALQTIGTLLPDTYYIFTDSLSSIEAIRSMKPSRESTYFLHEIRKTLNDLVARFFSINLVWVPSHCSIPGNEEADDLAKKGAAEGEIFERPIGFQEYYSIPRQQMLAGWQQKWSSSDMGRWCYSIFPKVSLKPWFKGLDLTRAFIRTMSRLMSNHYSSNAHLFRIKMSDTNLCTCDQGYEDIDHIVWSCSKYREHRKKFLDSIMARGRSPNTPIRDALATPDPHILIPMFTFLKDSKIIL